MKLLIILDDGDVEVISTGLVATMDITVSDRDNRGELVTVTPKLVPPVEFDTLLSREKSYGCENCDGDGWYINEEGTNRTIKACEECNRYATDQEAWMAARPSIG